MKIPVIKPLWKLAGKIATRVTTQNQGILDEKKAIISLVATVGVVVACVFECFSPFGSTNLVASNQANLDAAKYYHNITVKSYSMGKENYLAPLIINLNGLVSTQKLDSDFTGIAVIDGNLDSVPFMPTGNAIYFFDKAINANATQPFRVYLSTEDLNGDVVYMPSVLGMTVNGSSSLDFGSNDFEIEVDGYFNRYNNDNDAKTIFKNDEFELTYLNGQLRLALYSNTGSEQIRNLNVNKYINGMKSVTFTPNSATGNINGNVTIAYAPKVSTTINNNTTTGNAYYTGHDYHTQTLYSQFFGSGYHYGWWDTIVIRDFTVSENYTNTINHTTTTYNYTTLPVNINGTTTLITADGTDTLNISFSNKPNRTDTLTIGNTNTTKTITGNKSTTSHVTTNTNESTIYNNYVTFVTENVGGGTTYTIYDQGNLRINRETTITKTINQYNDYTVQVDGNALIGANADDSLAYGLDYYWVDNNSITKNWNYNGDTVLTVKRVGDVISVLQNGSTLMSAQIANGTAVGTNVASDWTIAQNGAMKYLRSMTIKNNGDNVAQWHWQKQNTFDDMTGNGNTAYPSFYANENQDQNISVTLGGEIAITSSEPTTSTSISTNTTIPPTTSTTTTITTTTNNGTTVLITQTKTLTGFVDTTTPDILVEHNEEDWENIFLFGVFFSLAEAGGIPPSIVFIPIMAILTIVAFMIAYHFTRDMFVSGIVGNCMLGVGIALSVFYTIPFIMGIILMIVLLVKRKTISL